jgi:hypothetical protein
MMVNVSIFVTFLIGSDLLTAGQYSINLLDGSLSQNKSWKQSNSGLTNVTKHTVIAKNR